MSAARKRVWAGGAVALLATLAVVVLLRTGAEGEVTPRLEATAAHEEPEVGDGQDDGLEESPHPGEPEVARDRGGSDVADPVAEPLRVVVPAIDVDAEVVPVGLLADGAMEVPDFGLAGWYDLGPKPGEHGPAVIAAHVDSRDGPDVFFRLRELAAGDEIEVVDGDGDVRRWEVTHQEKTDKDELPVDRIWNDTDEPVLRLITCGGEFDHGAGSYDANVTVYAEPVI